LKRKANETVYAKTNCDIRVVTASKCDIIKDENARSSKKEYSRKYDNSYLDFGFTWCGNKIEQKHQCVLCYEVLSSECMEYVKLRRHLETKHCDVKNKPNGFFQRRLRTLNHWQNFVVYVMGSINSKAVEVSCLLSLRIDKIWKRHPIGENLLLPAINDVVKLCLATSY
jgi:hypothetical protein